MAVILLAGCFCRCAATDDKPEDPDAPIRSLLAHGDTVFASTSPGLYVASMKEQKWRKMIVPEAMDPGGGFLEQDPASPFLAYCLPWEGLESEAKLFLSNDAGKTWSQAKLPAGHIIYEFYILPNGWLYAIEQKGQVTRYGEMCGLFCSKDKGVTWTDVTSNLPEDYSFGWMIQDPDHADQVCVMGHYARHISKGEWFQCDPATGHWTGNQRPGWHDELFEDKSGSRRYSFGPAHGKYPMFIRATLSNFFNLPFLEPCNQSDLNVFVVQVETEKASYTFPLKGPKIIHVKVVSLDGKAPVKFLENRDETFFWGMGLLPRGRDFAGFAPKDSEFGTGNPDPDRQKKIDAMLHAPGTQTVAPVPGHPYERDIDLSKMAVLTKPGTYKIQLFHEDAGVSPEGMSFGTGVIQVTITDD